ncbi:MAG TPA: MFS transporter [Alphaproteobacteria bacterium]|nr:MFS transporter [Alphaproteobacteria bacterium]
MARLSHRVDAPPLSPEALYTHWKWRVLLMFSGFYMFLYLGRFNFGFVIPQIIDDLGISRTTIGLVNACMFWGFGLGDLVHGRLSDRFSSRLWVTLGGALTAVFNWLTSFGTSAVTLLIPWAINGFVNAMCYSPGIRLIAQWWPRRERGRALGTLGIFIGFAMLIMWLVTGWVAGELGWRAAFRYPVLWIGFMSLVFWLVVRDNPTDLGLPDYVEEDAVSAAAEEESQDKLHGLQPYLMLLRNWRFLIACHVTGWGTLARYSIVTWAPLYYKEVGGFDIKAMALATVTFPIGMALGAPIGGIISDHWMEGRRAPMIIISCLATAAVLAGIAFASPSNLPLGMVLMVLGGFTLTMAPTTALGVDLAGRKISGTASGLLDAHAYLYNGLQAFVIGWILDATGGNWTLVFLLLAASRLFSAGVMAAVKA